MGYSIVFQQGEISSEVDHEDYPNFLLSQFFFLIQLFMVNIIISIKRVYINGLRLQGLLFISKITIIETREI